MGERITRREDGGWLEVEKRLGHSAKSGAQAKQEVGTGSEDRRALQELVASLWMGSLGRTGRMSQEKGRSDGREGRGGGGGGGRQVEEHNLGRAGGKK